MVCKHMYFENCEQGNCRSLFQIGPDGNCHAWLLSNQCGVIPTRLLVLAKCGGLKLKD